MARSCDVPACPRGGLTPRQMLLLRSRVDPPQAEHLLLLLLLRRGGGRPPSPGMSLLLRRWGGLTPPWVRPNATARKMMQHGCGKNMFSSSAMYPQSPFIVELQTKCVFPVLFVFRMVLESTQSTQYKFNTA